MEAFGALIGVVIGIYVFMGVGQCSRAVDARLDARVAARCKPILAACQDRNKAIQHTCEMQARASEGCSK